MKRATVLVAVSAVASALGFVDRVSAAQDFPSGPIRLVVPFARGGSTDTLARTIGQKMTETWSKQVVVDNRSGGSGVIGMEITKSANPDGQTLVLGYIANLGTAPALYSKLSPEDFSKLIRDEIPKWIKVVKDAGIRPE